MKAGEREPVTGPRPEETAADESAIIRASTRTKVCIWLIVLGLANFMAYAVAYDVIDGEAVHGDVRV